MLNKTIHGIREVRSQLIFFNIFLIAEAALKIRQKHPTFIDASPKKYEQCSGTDQIADRQSI